MKRIITPLLLTLSITCAAESLTGREAPAFSLTSPNGGQVNLSQYKGKVVYLDFWASWCGPCRKSFPWMNAIQNKYASQGLQVIGVNLDENNGDAAKFLKEMPAQFAIAFDGKAATPALYGVKGMPSSFLIGRDGKVILEHSGFNDADRAELEKNIRAAVEGAK
ncbi:TlpA family protein disulfide reductase [Novimethylophilus kurashikiensis]|nr:TlpA disulfide reductase family protein [Novimethylophilus kurashikiensis]